MKFLLVMMASGIARARTHDDDGIAQDGGHSAANRETEKYSLGLQQCYGRFTPVKTEFPLTSITRSYRGLMLRALRSRVF